MPHVGNKKFPYTPVGKMAAQVEAKKTGRKLRYDSATNTHRPVADSSAPVGEGGRFEALKEKIAAKGKVRNPGAVAAAIGRNKYGKARFQKMAAAGR